jgi:xylulokinase
MVGGGSRSSFWLKLLSSILNRKLSVCEQSEFGAALGVSRLAMFVDKNISNKNIIIKQVDIKESFEPDFEKLDNLEKRYNIWRNIYSTNKKININY